MNLDPEESRTTPPHTEDSTERGYVPTDNRTQDPVSYKNLGQPEHLIDDVEGDIADEGAGHRG